MQCEKVAGFNLMPAYSEFCHIGLEPVSYFRLPECIGLRNETIKCKQRMKNKKRLKGRSPF